MSGSKAPPSRRSYSYIFHLISDEGNVCNLRAQGGWQKGGVGSPTVLGCVRRHQAPRASNARLLRFFFFFFLSHLLSSIAGPSHRVSAL